MAQEGICEVFGPSVVLYLFFAGMGAGLQVTAFLCELMLSRSSEKPRDEQLLVQKAAALALALILAGSAFLLVDLTIPEKFMLVFRKPTSSVISFGASVIVAFSVLSASLLMLENFFNRELRALGMALKAVCALLALVIMAYTGLFLAGMKALPLWTSLLIVPLFFLSSLSSGLASFTLLAALTMRRPQASRMTTIVSHADTLVIILEAFVLFFFLADGFLSGGTGRAATMDLLFGTTSWVFWLLLVGAGIIAPLVVDATCRKPKPLSLFAKSLTTLTGCLALRYCVLQTSVKVLALT